MPAEQDNCAAGRLNKLATSVAQIRSVEASMARTADGLFENQGSADEVVRDLEDSGYPVDGSTGELIRQPDDLFVATDRIVAAPVQLDSATPSEDGGTSGSDVAEQGNAADVGVAPRAILGQL
jgi:hypothetical protein